jgi:guanylate kinase
LLPTDEEEWQRRLLARAKEQGTDLDMDIRVEKVKEELASLNVFDYAVVNADNQLEQTVEAILDSSALSIIDYRDDPLFFSFSFFCLSSVLTFFFYIHHG